MSSITKDLKTTRHKVIEYLLDEKKGLWYRNDDRKLTCRFWSDELKLLGINPKRVSGHDLLTLYAEGRLTSADVITRARRKAQEDNEQLRGSNWKKRHEEEEEVRIAVRNNQI